MNPHEGLLVGNKDFSFNDSVILYFSALWCSIYPLVSVERFCMGKAEVQAATPSSHFRNKL